MTLTQAKKFCTLTYTSLALFDLWYTGSQRHQKRFKRAYDQALTDVVHYGFKCGLDHDQLQAFYDKARDSHSDHKRFKNQ